MSWETYELLKQEWIAKHPNSTPQEYENAMRNIARKLGL